MDSFKTLIKDVRTKINEQEIKTSEIKLCIANIEKSKKVNDKKYWEKMYFLRVKQSKTIDHEIFVLKSLIEFHYK